MSLMTQSAAIVLGASGSVGQALVRALICNGFFDPIITLVRRSQPDQLELAISNPSGVDPGPTLREIILSTMNTTTITESTIESIQSLPASQRVLGFSVLGVGAGTAKMTLEAHRAIDVELNTAFARGLKSSGRVKHLAFMSSAGSNPTASTSGFGAPGFPRYLRVKGESEEAVKTEGPEVVSIFRPAMIIGSQHTPWILEKVMPVVEMVLPTHLKSISVDQIAKAMVSTSINVPESSKVYNYTEMKGLQGDK